MFPFTKVRGYDQETGEEIWHLNAFLGPVVGFATTTSRHPMYGAILDALENPETETPEAEEFAEWFNVGRGIERAVEDANLSSRVAVVDGQITIDGRAMSNALTDHILKLLSEQSGDLTGWVRFLERIEANPNEHSREALFSWLESLGRNDGGITTVGGTGPTAGFLVGYKGVRGLGDGRFESVTHGPAIVDGVEHKSGAVPQHVGAVVEMAREQVEHNPARGCSSGLHVGTWKYASGWGDTVIEVHIDPADVVSVPTDCDAQKMRCSRYQVVDVLKKPFGTATRDLDVDGDPDDDDIFAWDGDDDEIHI